jgi:hypothetical protein
MRFRTGIVLGVAIGYVLGTRAGRERYEQIRRMATGAARAARSSDKAKAAIDLGVERARDLVAARPANSGGHGRDRVAPAAPAGSRATRQRANGSA